MRVLAFGRARRNVDLRHHALVVGDGDIFLEHDIALHLGRVGGEYQRAGKERAAGAHGCECTDVHDASFWKKPANEIGWMTR
jgi:hypothetical protein